MNKFNISEQQYGFREKKSTEDAILNLTSKITTSLNESKPCLCIFIDLSKAFDTVCHNLLLQALDSIGIRGNSLKLFKNYLSERFQAVKVDGVFSRWQAIEYGVPQGSILCPILYNIYINDLFSQGNIGNITGFADDTAIFYSDDSWINLKTKAEQDFLIIKKFLDKKLLTINIEKNTLFTI